MTTANFQPTAPTKRNWLALGVLLAGMFIALLDTSIVNVALPSIRTSLNASESTLSWIISGYALTFGLALIPAGRLGDRFGHKWVYLIGVALFTIASVACGVAQNDPQIVIARVVQGLAGGIFLPAVTAFIQTLFHGKDRGKAFAFMGATIGVSTALGPIAGGLLIQAFGEADGWRWVFFVNIPIGIATVIAAALYLPAHDAEHVNVGLDWVGVVMVAGGLTAILVPLIQGQEENWPLWTFLSIAGGLIIFVLFALWEVAYAKRGRNPLVPPRLYAHANFTLGTILAMVYFAGFTSIFFSLSLFWQAGLHHSALETGLVSLPFAIGTVIGSQQSQRMAARFGRNALALGLALVTISLGSLWLILTNLDPTGLTNWILLPSMLIGGLGNGLFLAPNAQFIVATVERQDAGSASGVVNTMQRVGNAIGVAVVGSVLFGSLTMVAKTQQGSLKDIADGWATAAANGLAVSTGLALLSFLLIWALPARVASGHAPAAPVGE